MRTSHSTNKRYMCIQGGGRDSDQKLTVSYVVFFMKWLCTTSIHSIPLMSTCNYMNHHLRVSPLNKLSNLVHTVWLKLKKKSFTSLLNLNGTLLKLLNIFSALIKNASFSNFYICYRYIDGKCNHLRWGFLYSRLCETSVPWPGISMNLDVCMPSQVGLTLTQY